MSEDGALSDAHEAVRRARQAEEAGYNSSAEDHWEDAERLYEQAGLDPTWLDDANLAETLDEPNDTLELGGDPFHGVLIMYDPEQYEPGANPIAIDTREDQCIVALPEIIVPVKR